MNDQEPVAPRAPAPLRRNLLVAATFAIGAAIMTALGLPALLYLFSSPKSRKPSDWTEAGDISTLPPNAPVEIAFHQKRVDGWKVVSEKITAWVVKHPDNPVTAFGPQCTHLGCAYHWDERQERVPLPLPLFAVFHRRQGPLRPRAAPARPLRDSDPAAANCCIGRLRPPAETQA